MKSSQEFLLLKDESRRGAPLQMYGGLNAGRQCQLTLKKTMRFNFLPQCIGHILDDNRQVELLIFPVPSRGSVHGFLHVVVLLFSAPR